MKKVIFYSLLVLLCSTVANAQSDSTKFNLTSKRGFYYFPEKGDWALSINATPFLDYFGSFFGDKTYNYSTPSGYSSYEMANTSPSFAFTAQNPGSIYFKYYNKDNRSFRVKLLFGYSTSKDNDGSGEEDPKDVYFSSDALAIGLSVGQEFYRPIKSRIRGYYGYEVGFSSLPFRGRLYDKSRYVTGNVEYKNEADPKTNFTEEGGNTISFNGSGLLGVEWFFAPKISLGGEFGLGFNYQKQLERKFNNDNNKLIVDSGGNRFDFKPHASGDLILHIYF